MTRLLAKSRFNRLGFSILLLLLGGIGGIAFWFSWNARHNAGIQFLPRHHPAEWIVYPAPFLGAARPRIELETRFRREFVLNHPSAKARLSWRGFTRCSVALNGRPVVTSQAVNENWKEAKSEQVSALLLPGTNKVEVTVYNESGPPALWLSLETDELAIRSNTSWEASYAGAVWGRTRLAGETAPIMKGSPLYATEQTGHSFISGWAEIFCLTVISCTLLAAGRWGYTKLRASEKTAGSRMLVDPAVGCFAGLILGWVVLFIHNAPLLPRTIGFDAQNHMEYVDYIQERGRLPLANEGPTMYNPPFYYLMAACVLSACSLKTADVAGVIVLRYFGLLIGLVHLGLVFGSLRLIFPRQSGRQMIGLLIAGVLPAQLYLSHYVTNEVLASGLVTATIYLSLRALQENDSSSRRWFAGAGAMMGLALLTKFTALLVGPFVFAAVAFRFLQKTRPDWRACLLTTGLTALTCLIVCGWHYARVWIHFGKPVFGNWEASSGHFGWQDPGYRTAAYFFGFGQSLSRPFFSGRATLADAIYSTLWGDGYCGGVTGMVVRTPWNYELMCAAYLFALLPTMMILVGAFISLGKLIREPTGQGVILNGLAWSFVAALVYMALKFPTYALIKAFYGLLILLPVCTFGALGWDFLAGRSKLLRVSLSGALTVWAFCAFCSYWISSESAHTNLLLGLNLSIDGKQEEAVERLSAAVRVDPTNALAKALLADSLTVLGQNTEAERLRKELKEAHPEFALSQLAEALNLEKQGRLPEAVEHTRRAVEAAPEDSQSYRLLAARLLKLEQPSQALAACQEGLRIAPTDSELHFLLGMALVHEDLTADAASGDSKSGNEEAFLHLRLACKLSENSWESLNGLAWVLATHPRAQWRNGPEAARLAEQACQLTSYRQPAVLGTLAVAYAEVGRFAEAISLVQRAQSLTLDQGQKDPFGLHEEWIRLFTARLPFREPRVMFGGKIKANSAVTP